MSLNLLVALVYAHSDSSSQSFWATSALGWLTFGVLTLSGILLPITYWYIANRPNIIARPAFDNTFVTLHVCNEGRATARDLRVTCPTLIVSRSPEKSLDAGWTQFHARQEIEYYIGVGHELLDSKTYCVTLSHRVWLLRWPRFRLSRKFNINLGDYRHVLVGRESPSKLTEEVQRLSRTMQDVLQLTIHRLDRRRHPLTVAGEWLRSKLGRVGRLLRFSKPD